MKMLKIFVCVSVLSFYSACFSNINDLDELIARNVSANDRCGNGELLRPSYLEIKNVLRRRLDSNSPTDMKSLPDARSWTPSNFNWFYFDAFIYNFLKLDVEASDEGVDAVSGTVFNLIGYYDCFDKISAANEDVKRYLNYKGGFLRNFLNNLKSESKSYLSKQFPQEPELTWQRDAIQKRSDFANVYSISSSKGDFVNEGNIAVPQVHAYNPGVGVYSLNDASFVVSVPIDTKLRGKLTAALGNVDLGETFLISAPVGIETQYYYWGGGNKDLAIKPQWVFFKDYTGKGAIACDVVCNVRIYSSSQEISVKTFPKTDVQFHPGSSKGELCISSNTHHLGFTYDDILKSNGSRVVLYNVKYFSNGNSGAIGRSLNGKSLTGAIFVLNDPAREKFKSACYRGKSFADVLRELLSSNDISQEAFNLFLS